MKYNYTSIDIIRTNMCITFNFYFTVILLMGVWGWASARENLIQLWVLGQRSQLLQRVRAEPGGSTIFLHFGLKNGF